MLFLEMGKCFLIFLVGVGTHYIYRGLVGWGYLDFGFLGGFRGMKEIKKSGGGDVRAEALAWDDKWDKA